MVANELSQASCSGANAVPALTMSRFAGLRSVEMRKLRWWDVAGHREILESRGRGRYSSDMRITHSAQPHASLARFPE